MLDVRIPVLFPPDDRAGAEAGELGETEKARERKPIRPFILMMQHSKAMWGNYNRQGRAPPRKHRNPFQLLQRPKLNFSAQLLIPVDVLSTANDYLVRQVFPQLEGDCLSSGRLRDGWLPTNGYWTQSHQATSWSSHAPLCRQWSFDEPTCQKTPLGRKPCSAKLKRCCGRVPQRGSCPRGSGVQSLTWSPSTLSSKPKN